MPLQGCSNPLMLQTCIKNRLIRRGIVALALLAVLLGIPVAAAQTFDEAIGAFIRRDYATAIRGFRVHAEQGDASAQFSLGVMYANGEGILKNDAEAVRWYRLAAEQGHARAQLNLGVMYDGGRGVLKDDAEAVRWYRLAAEQGHARCPVQPRAHVRQGRGRPQGFRACAHVVQHRWRKRERKSQEVAGQSSRIP